MHRFTLPHQPYGHRNIQGRTPGFTQPRQYQVKFCGNMKVLRWYSFSKYYRAKTLKIVDCRGWLNSGENTIVYNTSALIVLLHNDRGVIMYPSGWLGLFGALPLDDRIWGIGSSSEISHAHKRQSGSPRQACQIAQYLNLHLHLLKVILREIPHEISLPLVWAQGSRREYPYSPAAHGGQLLPLGWTY